MERCEWPLLRKPLDPTQPPQEAFEDFWRFWSPALRWLQHVDREAMQRQTSKMIFQTASVESGSVATGRKKKTIKFKPKLEIE